MITLEINGKIVEVPEGTTILHAAEKADVKIPTLCYHPDLPPLGSCGLCVVKVEGMNKMVRACATPVEKGMKVATHDPEIVEVRKTVLELILSTHPDDCLQCPRNGECELQNLAADFGIRKAPFAKRVRKLTKDETTTSIVLNPERCIQCGRCAQVCQQMQNVWAIEFLGRGENTRIAPAADATLEESPCIKCGQCSAHCPVGAIYEKDETDIVWNALANKDLYPVVQIAPAVRVAIGESFGFEPGTIMTGQTYTALRRLGFKAVFDTNFGADLTIMEEGSELVKRMNSGKGALPLITSCCPSWTDYMEKYAPDFIDNFSTAKSPHEMVGAMAKTYYAEKIGVDPSKIFMVSVMPCTAKKFEISRTKEMFSSGYQDIDVSITTREFVRMIKAAGIDFANLPEEEADNILGEYSGAGTIFGTTGGVMEAALRTGYHLLTGKELENVEFQDVRGLEGVKEATIEIEGKDIRVAVAHWMTNIETVLDRVRNSIKNGEEPYYHFIEVMACRGGCVAGGGQPYGATDAIRKKRAEGLYKDDKGCKVRCSHQNEHIKQLYRDFLDAPLSAKAHKYLHTKYSKRPTYKV